MALDDTDTFLFSKNLVSVAQKHGWYHNIVIRSFFVFLG